MYMRMNPLTLQLTTKQASKSAVSSIPNTYNLSKNITTEINKCRNHPHRFALLFQKAAQVYCPASHLICPSGRMTAKV